jgi:fucose permease
MDLGSNGEQLHTPLLSGNNNTSMEDHHDDDEHEQQQQQQVIPTTLQQQPHTVMKWYQNPHQLTAMLSNFSTSYNVVNISLVLPILEELHSDTSSEDAAACASSLLAGMILGQLLGGALGDSFLGRLRRALRLVMVMQIVASLASALINDDDKGDIYVSLTIWRFILGVGAGGVYPLAAVLSAEQGANNHSSNNNGSSSDQIHRVVLLTFIVPKDWHL